MPTPREAFTNTVQREGYSGARLRPVDYGQEQIGRAVQGFGRAVAEGADTLHKLELRDAEYAAQEADNIRMARRMERLYDGPNAYFNQEGRNALIDQEQLREDLRKIDEEAAQVIANKPHARRMYDQLTVRRNADALPSISKHAAQERTKYEDATDEAAFDLAIDNASNSDDPTVIEANIATAGNLAAKRAQRKGMTDPLMVENARQAGIGKAVEAIAGRMELKSPGEAQAFVMTHADQMDPQDAGRLLASLAPAAAQERAGSDIGQFMVYSGQAFPEQPVAAAEGATAAPTPHPPEAALDAAQWDQESNGQHIDPRTGQMTTSPAGAKGISQVMPKTGPNPGYGVKPLQNNSREEYIRFGRDYRNAMIKHFGGNIVLGLTAYNWGPGNVEDHIAKVGDPRKGQISDAEFVNSIPNKEAREYAPSVLSKAGTSVSGKPGPSLGKPVPVGQELDLEATLNNIRSSDRTYIEKQALEREATRLHALGKQIKAEAAEAVSDEAQTFINTLPVGSFTNVSQLPLNIRQKLPAHPELYNSVRNMAHANAERQQAELDAKKKAEYDAKLGKLEMDLTAFMWNRPDQFMQIDFYTSPAWAKMGTEKVAYWMKKQQEMIESRGGKGANYDAIHTAIGRHTAKTMSDGEKGKILDYVSQRENLILNEPGRNGKPLTDEERDILVRQAITKATFVVGGVKQTGTRADAAAAGATQSQVNMYDEARLQLQRRLGRVPTPGEVEAAVNILRQQQAAAGGGS